MRPPTSSLFITSSSVVVNGEYNSAVRRISYQNKNAGRYISIKNSPLSK